MGWNHDTTEGVAGWLGMGLGMLVFWGLLIVLVVALVRWVGAAGGERHVGGGSATPGPVVLPGQPGYALRILQERFARGEISAEEFVARRDVLSGR